MKRKVILQGGKTLMVSLPKKWAERLYVKKGDELECFEEANRICFTASGELSISSIEVNLERLNERAVRYVLSGLHKTGYDEIIVLYDRPGNLEIIEELLRDLYVGFAIVEQDDRRCVLKSISRELSSEFEAALRRAFLVTLSLGESMLEAIRLGEFTRLGNLLRLEKTNNQLTNFCERLLNKNPYLAPKKQNFYYVIVWNLEKVCDDYKYICKELQVKKQVDKILIKGMEAVQALLRGYYELFYKFDIGKLSQLSKQKREIEDMLFGSKQKTAFYLLSCASKLIEFSASMTAVKHV